jgi:hypothetical protein
LLSIAFDRCALRAWKRGFHDGDHATPILSIAFASAGLAILVPYLDYVVLSALVIFLIVALYGYVRSKQEGVQPK